MSRRTARLGALVLGGLLVGHIALGSGRLPGKVWARRLDDIADYRSKGAARFLLDSAQLEGADTIEWLRQNVAADAAVLWRWPADDAFEFVAPLIAPRLLVDERQVPPAAVSHAGRPLARGTVPAGGTGCIVVQGNGTGGLRLLVREP